MSNELGKWAVDCNVPQNSLTSLLQILRKVRKVDLDHLPKDARTVLNTNRNIHTKTVAGGEYYYIGLNYWLSFLLKNNISSDITQLTLHINIDGIPLFNSSTVSLWPILGSVIELNDSVFPIALFCNNQKPDSLDSYLKDFIAEIKILMQDGFFHNESNKTYKVILGAIICDAPARAFVKCIKMHNGYNCCERCVQKGEWCGKIILPDILAPLRTDASFVAQEDPNHHVAISPLTELSFSFVSGFPLDYMHLICLGAVRRLINLWINGPPTCRLSQNIIIAISEKLSAARQYIPVEFSQKPRSLSEFKQWKATELRLFFIYTGPVVLRDLLPSKLYTNFLDLSVAVRILLCPSLLPQFIDFAGNLLQYFVQNVGELYGKDQLVYNIHSLIHIADDARRFGVLDNCSSFKYESYLGQLKKLVRKPQTPCAQIARRIYEGHFVNKTVKDFRMDQFKNPHSKGPIPFSLSHYLQYEQYHGINFYMSVDEGNNCFEINGKIGVIKNILKDPLTVTNNVFVIFEEFSRREQFFSDPICSDNLSIYFVVLSDNPHQIFPIPLVKRKYVMLPYKHGFVIMPQLHY